MKWLDDVQEYTDCVVRLMDGVDDQMLGYSQWYIPDLIASNKRLIAAVRFMQDEMIDDIFSLVEAQEYSLDDMCYQIRHIVISGLAKLQSGEFGEGDE